MIRIGLDPGLIWRAACDLLLRVKMADVIDNWRRIEEKGEAFAEIWRQEKRYLLDLLGQPAADTLRLLQPDHPCYGSQP